MNFLECSKKTVLLLNVFMGLSLLFLVGGGLIYPAYEQILELQNNLYKLQAQPLKATSIEGRIINFTDLLKIMKISLPALKILNMTMANADIHLQVQGSNKDLSALVFLLANSAVVSVVWQRADLEATLSLNLKELRVLDQALVHPRSVGVVLLREHHYCVFEGAAQTVYLREQVQC